MERKGPFLTTNSLFLPHSVGSEGAPPPVYCAHDLFLRRAISLAADMAESGRPLTPRNSGHGHSRAPLSAALCTISPADQARLANLFGAAAPASARAPVRAAHPPE